MVALEDELSVVLLHLVTQGVERDPLSVSVSGAGKPLEGRKGDMRDVGTK